MAIPLQESMELRAPLLYYEHIGKFEEEDGYDGPQGAGLTGLNIPNAPKCQNLGTWREDSGVGRALADLLLHGIDRQELRLRRDAERERRQACGMILFCRVSKMCPALYLSVSTVAPFLGSLPC